jgi:hypothetical protein
MKAKLFTGEQETQNSSITLTPFLSFRSVDIATYNAENVLAQRLVVFGFLFSA